MLLDILYAFFGLLILGGVFGAALAVLLRKRTDEC